jgi:hypothetical protein
MERIVGLLKWIGEMGCPPFYKHAILYYISRRLIASHAILLRVYNVILIFVKTIISKYNIIIIITIRNRYTSSTYNVICDFTVITRFSCTVISTKSLC